MKIFTLILLLSSFIFGAKIELEILGSGGPEIDKRASTSYLLWIDNKARLLVDMGSGSMLHFEHSEAKLKDLEAVVLTHLHIDHSVDLASFVKAGYFSSRIKPLEIIGPRGNKYFPSIDEFLQTLFGKKGVYRYMNDVLYKQSDSFQIIPYEIDSNIIITKKYKDFNLELINVHHGIIPALALAINVDGKKIVISGDTNNQNNNLQKITKNANLFVAHHAIAQSQKGYATKLHMSPSIIAELAHNADVEKLLLTHRMKRTLGNEKNTLSIIKKKFNGKTVFAEDKMKILIE